jgi:FAD/FMN-containing dehydrogenase
MVLPGGGALARVSRDAAAFGEGRQAPFNFMVDAGWADPAADEENIAWARGLADAMKPFAAGNAYLNFIGEEGRDRVRAAFGDRGYGRLQALKDRYDPDNVFRRNQNVEPSGSLAAIPG